MLTLMFFSHYFEAKTLSFEKCALLKYAQSLTYDIFEENSEEKISLFSPCARMLLCF